MCLPRRESQGHDTTDVHLGSIHMHIELELIADGFDILETFLVVRPSTTDPDLDVMLDEDGSDFSDGADDTLESGGDLVAKVSNGFVYSDGSNLRW